ncbi:MAG: hypothetical protein EB101_07290 [Chitinophagia bacterium]|nr:hypothetical protein [Chitinophagia bacterium]
MNTDSTTLLLLALLGATVGGLIYGFFKTRTPAPAAGTKSFDTLPLRLQAYERLVLLTERMALPNLISRVNNPAASLLEMKVLLTENIKQEFEYNSTQQLYVSATAWEAVRNLKEQNILLINQVAASMGNEATGATLNKKLLDILLSQQQEPLHDIVTRVLNQEAKQLMS